MPAGRFDLSWQRITDINNVPVAGALIDFFDAGTTTPRTVYQDDALATPYGATVTADAYGLVPGIYMPSGAYKWQAKTSGGVLVPGFAGDNIYPPLATSSGGGGGSVTDAEKYVTGDIKIRFSGGVLSGFVRCNARTIGSASSGASERANADTSALYTYLWDNFSNTICPVSSGRGASAAADFAANKAIGTPDGRFLALRGLADMGNSAISVDALVGFFAGNSTTGGSIGGSQTDTLTTARIPAHAHTLTDPGHGHTLTDPGHVHSLVDPLHNHTIKVTTAIQVASGAGASVETNNGTGPTAGAATGQSVSSATTGASIVTNTTGITMANTGSGQAHNNVSPFVLVTYYMKL